MDNPLDVCAPPGYHERREALGRAAPAAVQAGLDDCLRRLDVTRHEWGQMREQLLSSSKTADYTRIVLEGEGAEVVEVDGFSASEWLQQCPPVSWRINELDPLMLIVRIPSLELWPPLPAPGDAERVADLDLRGQSFDQWSPRVVPCLGRAGICLLPIGDPSGGAEELTALKCFIELWFGLPVKELPCLQGKELRRFKARPCRGFGPQLLASEVAKFIQVLKPFDCLCIIGYTLIDLYAQEAPDDFVYGTTLMEHASGVLSFARLRTDDGPLFLRRCAATLAHEIGHFFGLATCIWYWCTMNDHNHEDGTDSGPLMLCPVDLRKLDATLSAHLGGLDFLQQADRLAEWCAEHGLDADANWWTKRCSALVQLSDAEAANATAPHSTSGGRRSLQPPSPGGAPPRGGRRSVASRSDSGLRGDSGRMRRAQSESAIRRPQEEGPPQLSTTGLSPVQRTRARGNTTTGLPPIR